MLRRKLTLFLTDIHVALGGEGGDRSRVARAATVRVPRVAGVHLLQSLGFYQVKWQQLAELRGIMHGWRCFSQRSIIYELLAPLQPPRQRGELLVERAHYDLFVPQRLETGHYVVVSLDPSTHTRTTYQPVYSCRTWYEPYVY